MSYVIEQFVINLLVYQTALFGSTAQLKEKAVLNFKMCWAGDVFQKPRLKVNLPITFRGPVILVPIKDLVSKLSETIGGPHVWQMWAYVMLQHCCISLIHHLRLEMIKFYLKCTKSFHFCIVTKTRSQCYAPICSNIAILSLYAFKFKFLLFNLHFISIFISMLNPNLAMSMVIFKQFV